MQIRYNTFENTSLIICCIHHTVPWIQIFDKQHSDRYTRSTCTDIEPVQCCNAGGPAGAAGRCVGSWRLKPLSTANLSRLPQMLSLPQDTQRFYLPLTTRLRANSQEIISLTWNRRRRRRRRRRSGLGPSVTGTTRI